MENGDRIFKWLQKCNRNVHIPDLHTFKARIKNGFVWVECRGFEVFIETYTYDKDGNETRTPWAGTTIAAANKLEMLGIDMETIEM